MDKDEIESGSQTPIRGPDSYYDPKSPTSKSPNARVQVPIKGFVTNKASMNGSNVRNSESRTLEHHEDWNAAPRLRSFAKNQDTDPRKPARGAGPIKADHS